MIPRRGFTLLEVILSLGLIAALLAGVFAFLFQVADHRRALAAGGARQQGADALFERLEADLLCGMAAGPDGSPGIEGEADHFKVLTRAVWLPPSSSKAGAAGDLQASEYTFDAPSGTVRLRRWAGVDPPGDDPETIGSEVQLLRFRYYDGQRWTRSFNSVERGSLPVAVEAAVWFGPPITGGPPASQDAPEDTDADALRRRSGGGHEEGQTKGPGRDPDRVRLIVVPDGPVEAWKERR
jgi:prepilin-type N-terminal cleavage/methylation domain-containing protein